MLKWIYFLTFIWCVNFSNIFAFEEGNLTDQGKPTFEIDMEKGSFMMDGEPFQFVAGSLHYFRVPHQYWRERLRALRAAGLNTVTTYVEWSFHEPEKGKYNWSEDRDLVKFIELAIKENLFVILRPGPYICAERDMGGLPYWLLHHYPNIKLRTNDEDYKAEITLWYAQLMFRMRPYLYGNGGPIIMVQVENEYGSFPACDHDYMKWLASLTRSWVENNAVLFTTDGPLKYMLECGSTPDAYPVVDFGPGSDVESVWNMMKEYSGNGPMVNSEYYTGWLTHWGEDIAKVSAEPVTKTLSKMLDLKGNVNFYMFYGGTNFEYTAGANFGDEYTPDITSYDYDAPLTEAGDPTPKYFAIRETLSKYFGVPKIDPPVIKPKLSTSHLYLEPKIHLLSEKGRMLLGRPSTYWERPPTMEKVGQRSGLILYETKIDLRRPDPSALFVEDLRDRALIYMDQDYTGVLSRRASLNTAPIFADGTNKLQILVENQGRVNYGPIVNDFKGIIGNVTLNKKELQGWDLTSFPLETIEESLQYALNETWSQSGFLKNGPVVYTTTFQIKEKEFYDSYLDVTGWGKGYAWVNDRHLGRYWPKEGPQVTLYTPGVYFKLYPEWNTLTVLELQNAPKSLSMKFVDGPIGV